ncbi:MAG: uracil-DNA glycosylase family protein [Proteobacteria bacterium]|nr:uracil-DNA glycosylase family protein [Pseudomonadota bacterium]
MPRLGPLLREIAACRLCAAELPDGPRPVLQAHGRARILIAGQAPGRRVHASGVPFDDPSGDRLREWMGIDRESFYDPKRVAVVPMGFCYPGSGRSGDLPPRPECAATWHETLLRSLKHVKLTLALGQYAQAYHLDDRAATVTQTVREWQHHWPRYLPLPHPSPRNRAWFARNPWFEREVIPALRRRVRTLLNA